MKKEESVITELLTKDEQKLEAIRIQMDSEERYSEKWFSLKEKYQELFKKIEKARR